jgi:O-antigen ligase
MAPSDGTIGQDRVALPDWFVLLTLLFMVATEYKFRRRSLADSLGGSLDTMVMVEIGVYGLIAVAMAALHLRGSRPAKGTPVMVSLWVYAGVTAASSAYAPFPNLAMVRAGQLLVLVAFVQMLADRAEPGQFRVLGRAYVGLMVASIMVGLAYVAPTSRYQAGRFTWLHTHTVTAAAMMAIGLVIAVGLLTIPPAHGRRSWQSLALVVGALAIAGALFMTKTRGSMGGAVVGLFAYTVLRVSKQRRKGVVVLMGLGAAGLLYFGLPALEAYVTRGESTEGITTLSNRTTLWSIAYEQFQRKPIFGWGFTASRGLFFDAVQLGGAHNAFVNAAVDGGLIGLGAWLTYLGSLMVGLRRAWTRQPELRPQVSLLSALLIAMLVNSVTMEGIGSGSGASFLWLCLVGAWLEAARRDPVGFTARPFGAERRGAAHGTGAPRRRRAAA